MNPKNALSDNNKQLLIKPIMKPIDMTILSIKQKEQLQTYFPEQVKTYPLPINYII